MFTQSISAPKKQKKKKKKHIIITMILIVNRSEAVNFLS